MSEQPSNLEKVRRAIDEIDESIHDAVMRRAVLIDDVVAAKRAAGGGLVPMRPGREAAVLRRLLDRHRGTLPPAVIARIWRELINAVTALQGPFAVAVCAPEKSVGYWDLARNHFGSSTPMTLHVSPTVVLRAISENKGVLGLLPLPQDREDNPWWPSLATEMGGEQRPRIIWRLPFFGSPAGRFETLGALVVSHTPPEPTGDDVSVLMIRTTADVSRARLLDVIASLDLKARVRATREDEGTDSRLHLLEIFDYLPEDDPRLAVLAEKIGEEFQESIVLGAYPTPMAGADGDNDPASE